jgi:hypothetical protein
MPSLSDIRKQYPQYSDMSDGDLASALHQKFYADMPRGDFDKAIGFSAAPVERSAIDKLTGQGGARYQAWPERLVRSIGSSILSGVTLPGDVHSGKARVPSSGAVPGSVPFGDPESAGERVADLVGLTVPINPAVRAGDMMVPGARVIEGPARYETTLVRPTSDPLPVPQGTRVAPTLETEAVPSVSHVPNLVREKPVAPSAEELASAATQGFNSAKGMGVEINPVAMQRLGSQIERELQSRGILEEHAPTVYATLKRLGAEAPEGSFVTLSDIHNLRQAFGNAAGSNTPKDKLAGSMGIAALDRYLADIPKTDVLAGPAPAASKTLKDAIGNFAAAARSDSVTGRTDLAELRAKVANSGQNVDNSIRQRFVDIASEGKAARGFSDEEIAQALRIAEGSPGTNAARKIGNLLGGGGGLGMAVTGGLGAAGGAAMGGPAGAGVGAVLGPVVGAAAKKVANAMTRREANLLDDLVRQRSPLFEQMQANPRLVQGPRANVETIARLMMSAGASSLNESDPRTLIARIMAAQ